MRRRGIPDMDVGMDGWLARVGREPSIFMKKVMIPFLQRNGR